jgi:exosortase/archaeosortase family protein
MIKNIKENEGLMFIIKILSVYLIWTIIRKTFNNTDTLFPYWTSFNDLFATRYIIVSSWILENWFDYNLVFNKRNIIPINTAGIYVGNHCLGISAKFIFIAIILSLKGKWINKLWFIPLGIATIILVNIIRITLLAIQLTQGDILLFDLNHKYTFVIIVYLVIFAFIMVWEKYFTKDQ